MDESGEQGIDGRKVEEAARRIRGRVRRTPVVSGTALDGRFGCALSFKCEHLQPGGSFKVRGAFNAVFSLEAGEAARGVAAHSSGNHATALALAARARGIPAHLVMPENSSRVKIGHARAAGGRITFCAQTPEAREKAAEGLLARTGAVLVHPFDDPRVIAGQGTAAAEFLEQAGPLDLLLVPVGGGGLISGTAIAASERSPGIRVIGVEPEGAADAWRGFRSGTLDRSGKADTMADGLRSFLSDLTFSVIRSRVNDIVTVSEAGIRDAMGLLAEEAGQVVEPSAAVPLAALLEERVAVAGRRVGILLTGGNLDRGQ